MKKLILIFLVFFSLISIAQPVRIYFAGGISNYAGDIQSKPLTMDQGRGVGSIGATFNITEKLALRGSYSFAGLGADDKKGATKDVIARNLNFKTEIHELTLLGEYDIFNLNEKSFSPYVFGGVAVFNFNPYTFSSIGNKVFLEPLSTEGQGLPEYPYRKRYKLTQLSLPVGGGLKLALSDDVQLGFELGYRKLLTDYLDDVSNSFVDKNVLLRRRGQAAVDLAFRGDEVKGSTAQYPPFNTSRGNPKSKDAYYFGQARISFRMSWFDNGSLSERGRRRGLGCPSWK